MASSAAIIMDTAEQSPKIIGKIAKALHEDEELLQQHIDDFISAAHEAASHYHLMNCSCGNLSWRLKAEDGTEYVLVTCSGSWMSNIKRAQVAVCRLDTGECLNGLKPSSEIRFHLGTLRSRPDVDVVLHSQTPYATAVASGAAGDIKDYAAIVEVPYYIGPACGIPFLPPGSSDLAEAVIEGMKSHDLVMMANHGQVLSGTSFNDVFQKAAFLELNCQIRLVGGKPLPQEDCAKLRNMRTTGEYK